MGSELNVGGCSQISIAESRGHRVAGRLLTICALMLILPGVVVAERQLYRYQTESGVMVQSDRLPAGAAARGYSIVSSAGNVLKVVPRQLSEEERAQRDRSRQQELAAQEEQERLRAWDQSLYLRYSGTEDIDDAMRRGLLKYDTRIGILRGNLQSLKSQIEQRQGDAANYLRRGRKVPESLQQQIGQLRSEVSYVEHAIVELRQERVEAELQFHNDKERFAYLLEQSAASR